MHAYAERPDGFVTNLCVLSPCAVTLSLIGCTIDNINVDAGLSCSSNLTMHHVWRFHLHYHYGTITTPILINR